MATELDILMDIDPLNLTIDNLDEIIAYYRKRRAEREAGTAKRPAKDSGPGVSLDGVLKNLIGAKPQVTVKRRV